MKIYVACLVAYVILKRRRFGRAFFFDWFREERIRVDVSWWWGVRGRQDTLRCFHDRQRRRIECAQVFMDYLNLV